MEPGVDPTGQSWAVPCRLEGVFGGFEREAFAILERLREAPHIEQYRREKAGVKRYLTEPFKLFRDDLVVNWVLPCQLGFETEKNVFSRLLKNDFGAGGCHHHLWMAFYRPSYRRLTDVQLSHSITPTGFSTGLFVGEYARERLVEALVRIEAAPALFLSHLNPLLQEKNWRMAYYYGTGARTKKPCFDVPLACVPDDLARARGLWIRRTIEREEVLRLQGDLVRWTLETLHDLWPIYQFIGTP